jgi:hypothetical protein
MYEVATRWVVNHYLPEYREQLRRGQLSARSRPARPRRRPSREYLQRREARSPDQHLPRHTAPRSGTCASTPAEDQPTGRRGDALRTDFLTQPFLQRMYDTAARRGVRPQHASWLDPPGDQRLPALAGHRARSRSAGGAWRRAGRGRHRAARLVSATPPGSGRGPAVDARTSAPRCALAADYCDRHHDDFRCPPPRRRAGTSPAARGGTSSSPSSWSAARPATSARRRVTHQVAQGAP